MKGPTIRLPPSLKPAIICIALIASVVALLGVAHVARRQQVITLGYQLTEAVTELHRMEEENRRLRLEKSVLTNPERIQRLARGMGMGQPTAGQIIVVRAQGSTVAAAPSAPKERSE